MSAPAPPPPPQFVPPPPFVPGRDSVCFWPKNPINNEQSRAALQPEFSAFKKPRISEDDRSIALVDDIKNPKFPPPTRGSKIFFKTRPCPRFREGTCPYGSNCNFAHGIEDIRKPPPNWQEIAAPRGDDRMGKWEEDLKIISRHRLCKNFYNGKVCPYGDRCNYLHEDPAKFRDEFGRSRESSVISISVGAPLNTGARSEQSDAINTANSHFDANWLNLKHVPRKTRMCNKWETSGSCHFGDKCHFAHGLAELKKFSGHNEPEMENVSTAPPKAVPNPANNASVNNAVTGASSKKQVLNKFLSKWKGPEKISRIYADWIDDIQVGKRSPSKAVN